MLLQDLEQKTALICQLDQNLKHGNPANFDVSGNLFTCLGKAAGEQFELIVISFSNRQISARKPIIVIVGGIFIKPDSAAAAG